MSIPSDSTDKVRHVVGPLDRIDLAIPLLLFMGAGIPIALFALPESWPLALRVGAGAAIGLLSWMFPYLNRVLEG